jgi:hypothetical protein
MQPQSRTSRTHPAHHLPDAAAEGRVVGRPPLAALGDRQLLVHVRAGTEFVPFQVPVKPNVVEAFAPRAPL